MSDTSVPLTALLQPEPNEGHIASAFRHAFEKDPELFSRMKAKTQAFWNAHRAEVREGIEKFKDFAWEHGLEPDHPEFGKLSTMLSIICRNTNTPPDELRSLDQACDLLVEWVGSERAKVRIAELAKREVASEAECEQDKPMLTAQGGAQDEDSQATGPIKANAPQQAVKLRPADWDILQALSEAKERLAGLRLANKAGHSHGYTRQRAAVLIGLGLVVNDHDRDGYAITEAGRTHFAERSQ